MGNCWAEAVSVLLANVVPFSSCRWPGMVLLLESQAPIIPHQMTTGEKTNEHELLLFSDKTEDNRDENWLSLIQDFSLQFLEATHPARTQKIKLSSLRQLTC